MRRAYAAPAVAVNVTRLRGMGEGSTVGHMTDPVTLPDSLTRVVGTPGPDATHWGIWRMGRGKPERLAMAEPGGAHTFLWPLSTLSLEEVSKTWGGGDFQLLWMVEDPENPQPELRRRSAGKGTQFKIDAPTVPHWQNPIGPGFPNPAQGPPSGGFNELERAIMMMRMLTEVSRSNTSPAILRDDPNIEVVKELAAVKAQLAADQKLREVEEKHRREVDDLKESVRDEKMRRRRLEEESERGPGITLKDGDGVWDVVKRHFASDPGKALKQLTDLFRSAPMMLSVVMQAAQAAQQNPAPKPKAMPRAQAAPQTAPAAAAAPAPAPAPAPQSTSLSDMARDFGEPRAKEPAKPAAA